MRAREGERWTLEAVTHRSLHRLRCSYILHVQEVTSIVVWKPLPLRKRIRIRWTQRRMKKNEWPASNRMACYRRVTGVFWWSRCGGAA